MKLNSTHTFPAPRGQVFAAITDPAVLQRIIDGCERMVRTGDGTYDAHLTIGFAGIKGSYVGKVTMTDVQAPARYTLGVEGKGKPGFLKAAAVIRLEEAAGGGTELHCEADAQVGGMIAAVGSRLIEAAAKRMMGEFFRKLAIELEKT